jgi:hypothetical protein
LLPLELAVVLPCAVAGEGGGEDLVASSRMEDSGLQGGGHGRRGGVYPRQVTYAVVADISATWVVWQRRESVLVGGRFNRPFFSTFEGQ